MKRTLFLIMLIVLSIMSQAVVLDVPAIEMTMLNQGPDPVNPGSYVDVRFKISNTGNSKASDLELMIDPQYPFSLAKDDEPTRRLGDLTNIGDDNSVVVKYKLRVAEDAIQGENKIKLMYKHGTNAWITQTFLVSVETVDANVAIVSINTLPDKVKPGEKAVLEIKVKNLADSSMRDVALKLDLTYDGLLNSATAKTATDSILAFNLLPFAPLGSASEQKIDLLKSGEEHTFKYTLVAYSDAESKIYKIPVEITYYDELENKYTKEDIIGLIVGSKPDLSVVIENSELYVGKRTGNVIIKFVNKGFSGVKFLDVTLKESDEYQILTTPEVYIGNVDSDDYETAEYNLYLTNGATKQEKSVKLPLHVEYRDANNNIYTEDMDLELKVLDPNKLGIKQNNGSGIIFPILVIGVAIFFYLRRKKRKK